MKIEADTKLDYSDVLIRPKRSELKTRKEVVLDRAYTFKRKGEYQGVPIMAANMDGVGTFEMADELRNHRLFTCLIKTYSKEQLIDFFNDEDLHEERSEHTAISIGVSNDDLNKFKDVYKAVGDRLKYVCVDVANGYSNAFATFISELRNNYPDITIIAGNVVTGEMTEELILSGADIVKVGIGPGSVCTTRIQTGIGYPQLSAVIDCADAAHGLGGHIIADGGCTCPGDVAKAFAAGADFVMLGGMLAGHTEGGGDVITRFYETNELVYEVGSHLGNRTRKLEKKQFISFYGMSSKSANEKHFGGLKEYRSSEGREVLIPFRGGVKNTIFNILGGLRSTCTYVGARELKHLSKCTTFVRCNNTHNRVFENKQ